MNIQQLANHLNNKAIADGYEIAQLPELRKKYLNKKQLPGKIFSAHTIFSGENAYAFHHGGRDEMQFNVGREYIGQKEFTRYALCFSLEKSQSLTDPVRVLTPFKKKLNHCIEEFNEFFSKFEMWYFKDGKRSNNFDVKEISDDWFQEGVFIAIGNIINRPISNLEEKDLTTILRGFDNLLSIYKYCVLESPSFFNKENRISKICWNDNDWMSPSGPTGKSRDTESYERKRGYGHEEWLFDFDKTIDGYHYSLIQSVENGRETFVTKNFDVRLFSRNSETSRIFWIGSIKNLEVISIHTADSVYKKYEQAGWIEEMAHQIKSVDGDFSYFQKLPPHHCFNIRFKPEDAQLNKPFKKVTDFDKVIRTYHYQFIKDRFKKEKDEIFTRDFKFKSSKPQKSLAKKKYVRSEKVIQSKPLHDNIQQILYDVLLENYKEEDISVESNTGLNTRIDVSVRVPNGIILYEVKSYPSVMISIRIAIGQLLEYAFWPNPINNIKELIIVSHISANKNDINYLKNIRKVTSLKIFYQSIDLNSKTISEKM